MNSPVRSPTISSHVVWYHQPFSRIALNGLEPTYRVDFVILDFPPLVIVGLDVGIQVSAWYKCAIVHQDSPERVLFVSSLWPRQIARIVTYHMLILVWIIRFEQLAACLFLFNFHCFSELLCLFLERRQRLFQLGLERCTGLDPFGIGFGIVPVVIRN
jgi:hypothetical protein